MHRSITPLSGLVRIGQRGGENLPVLTFHHGLEKVQNPQGRFQSVLIAQLFPEFLSVDGFEFGNRFLAQLHTVCNFLQAGLSPSGSSPKRPGRVTDRISSACLEQTGTQHTRRWEELPEGHRPFRCSACRKKVKPNPIASIIGCQYFHCGEGNGAGCV